MDRLPDHSAPNGATGAGEARLPRDPFAARGFLATHRATLICAREVALLLKTVAAGADALNDGGLVVRPAIRRSPHRCIVQLGPVAITIAWLPRGHASIEDGALLVILWRGIVAPPVEHETERVRIGNLRSSATAVAEQTYRPVASNATSWNWKPEGLDHDGYASAELGARCVEWLRTAYSAAGRMA